MRALANGTLALLCALPMLLCAGEVVPEKPKGPEHSVTLNEETGVLDLLNKAQKARERAEKDPQVWPECVKIYGDILKKYANTVYLDRWEGPDQTEMAYKNGLYKSTRERVMREIASLPAGGLAIYRVINDPAARNIFNEAQEQFDERKMEQVAQEYFPTSFGDDALLWLAEISYDRGEARQAVMRLNQALKHPSLKAPKSALMLRIILSQIALKDRAGAEKTLADLEAFAKQDNKAEIRLGSIEGAAAIDQLRGRIAAIEKGGAAEVAGNTDRGWQTYFGNSAHNRTPLARKNIGLKKWSVPLVHLLYGTSADISNAPKVTNNEGVAVSDPTINQHVTVQDGYFYICDAFAVAAYPLGNPQPGTSSAGGNVKFLYPNDLAPKQNPKDQNQRRRFMRMPNMGVRQHPFFATAAEGKLFAVIGAEAMTMDPDMFRAAEVKQPPNYLVALGWQSGKLLWSLQPDSHSQFFESQSKADQEWLKSIFFVSAPTYDSGVLYVMAVQTHGLNEAWVVAFDADNGRLLWRTQVCAANPYTVGGVVQPDMGLPVAVANGTVYVVTNLGAVAALEANSGGIKWLRVYDRMQQMDRFNNRGIRVATDFWGPNPPIVYNNLLICTPQDSDILYAYDIETGRRVWQIERTGRGIAGNDESLKHVLGISNGNLVVSGINLHFYELKSGKKTAGPLEFIDSPVKGRGVATDGVILVPTERALVSVELPVENNRIRPKLLDKYKWEKAEEEAGNVFVAGDVLYTISHTHINAYFVWQEREAKLKERLEKAPDDLAAIAELVDVYQKVDKFERALEEADKGLQFVEKMKDDPKAAAALPELRRRKFDALYSLGRRADNGTAEVKQDRVAAYDFYKRALEVARLQGMPDSLPVIALRAMAENAAARNESSLAVQHYHEIITRHGDAIYGYSNESSSKARLFAQARIEELKSKDAASYAKLEAEAKAALENAGNDTAQLEALLTQYPNSDTSGAALLKLAQVSLEKNPDQTRQYVLSFMGRFAKSPELPTATALLAAAYERAGMVGPAKDILQRLANKKEFATATSSIDPANPQSKPAEPIKLAEWAKKRLAEAQYQRPSSAAVMSMGDGRLKSAWKKNVAESSSVLQVQGIPPGNMRRVLFFVENQTELSAVNATSQGDELWTPHPKLPVNPTPRQNINNNQVVFINGVGRQVMNSVQGLSGLWAGPLLIVNGEKELVAYDSREKGRVVWRKDLKNPMPQQRCSVQAAFNRLVVGYPGGELAVLDAATGEQLWQTQLEGNQSQGSPAVGDGFIAFGGVNPPRIVIFDTETGHKRGMIDIQNWITIQDPTTGNPRPVEPIAVGDRLYFAERNNQLKAVDGMTGKLIWQTEVNGSITRVEATRELLVAVTDRRAVYAMPTDGEGERKKWSPVLPMGAQVRDIQIDGEDLYVAADMQQQRGKLVSYSIPKEGKIQWDVDVSSEQSGGLPLDMTTVAVGHLLLTQANWDATGDKASSMVLVDRKTGKLTWMENLSSDPMQRQFDPETGMARPAFQAQMIDGGVVVTEGKRRAAFLIGDGGNIEENIKAMQEKLQKNPDDLELRANLGLKQLEKGDIDAGVANVAAVLSNPNITEEKFVSVYAQFSRIRQELAKKNKRAFNFLKVADGSKLDANPQSWTAIPESALNTWRDVYMPSDDETAGTIKKDAWKGPDDLRATFRGAYDDKNLYLLFVVNDEHHKNEWEDSTYCDLGDSVKVVFDINRDGGMGYRGEMFAVGASLNDKGAVLSKRWVEHGKILPGEAPLQPAPLVQRNEAQKQTVYRLVLPLEYLKLKPEAGRKFGFSFVVNDQDAGSQVTKSIGASPGVLDPVYPTLFAEGVLQEK